MHSNGPGYDAFQKEPVVGRRGGNGFWQRFNPILDQNQSQWQQTPQLMHHFPAPMLMCNAGYGEYNAGYREYIPDEMHAMRYLSAQAGGDGYEGPDPNNIPQQQPGD